MITPQTETPLRPVWLLKLVFQFPYGGWLSGALIFLVIYAAFWICADIREVGALSTLFLSGMVAYIIPVYGLIIRRSEQAYDALEHLLDADAARKRRWRQSLGHRSASWMSITTGFGLSMGLMHSAVLEIERGGSIATTFSNSASVAVTALATVVVWVTMTIVISSISSNAWLFYKLGRDHLHINLLNTRELVPLAWVSVASTLSLIGAQALFALLIFDPGAGFEAVLPGFVGTAVPMLPMFFLPIWSVHKRLQLAKADELQAINKELERASGNKSPLQALEKLAELNQLLAYRHEISNVHAWPFDIGAISRLGLYLIIPPLTWVGAALVENLVENLL